MIPPTMPSSTVTILLIVIIAVCSAAAATSPPTAYSVLRSFNFPPGLLPRGATSYTLDPATGKFTVRFNGTCAFSFLGSYDIRYKPEVSGRISDNKLRDLKGVSVKILVFWINVVEVDRSGDELDFSVGIASVSFSVEYFEVVPGCGCGLGCPDRVVGLHPIRLRGSF